MSSNLESIIPLNCRVEYKNKVHTVDSRDYWTNRVYLLGIGWVPATHVTRTKRPIAELSSIQALIARTIRNHTPTTTTTTTLTYDPLTEWAFSNIG